MAENPSLGQYKHVTAIALAASWRRGPLIGPGGRGQVILRSGNRLENERLEDDPTFTLRALLDRLHDAAARAGSPRPRRLSRRGRRHEAVRCGRPTGCRRGRLASFSRRPAVTRRSRVWPGRPDQVFRRPKERRKPPGRWNVLRRAVANGYRNTNQLRIESALDPLRNRADFKKLMAELEKNSPLQQEKK